MKPSRRSFLQTGLGLPLALSSPCTIAPVTAAVAPSMESPFDPWIELHPQNFRHNVGEIIRRVSGCPILAVIKNNAYGAGVHKPLKSSNPIPEFPALPS